MAGRRGSRASGGCAPGRPCPGWCSGFRGGAGRRGFCGRHTHPIGADAWPARPDAGHADLLQHGFKLRRVSTLPCRHHDRHGLLTRLNCQVELGREPAARPSQPMITGLGKDTARWFLLQVALLAGPGRMLMGAADRGVDAQVPRDRTLRVGQGLEPGEEPLPRAVPLPSAEQVIDPAPRSIRDGDIPPRNTGSDPEPYAVDQLPPRPDRRPPRLLLFGNNGSSTAHCSSVRSPRPMNRDHSRSKIHFRYTA